jgi:hypothetical protein
VIGGFYEAMERSNTMKITDEILARLSDDSEDSEDFDFESVADDDKERPWRPSHVDFDKSTMKRGHIEAMNGKYFHDVSIVRPGGESIVPLLEKDEVVVYRSFLKVGLRFPLHKILVEVFKRFEIYLHQLTPEALIKVGIFIWAVRSQVLEPDADCFCNIHNLFYQTKATRKEQYHNNFGCYTFLYQSDARRPVPTFRKKWTGPWMKQWFYIKTYLDKREDIRGVIQWPIWSRFSIKRPGIVKTKMAQDCMVAFNVVCSYISTRDLVQEHITFKVWPLVNEWEMPKEVDDGSSQSAEKVVWYI